MPNRMMFAVSQRRGDLAKTSRSSSAIASIVTAIVSSLKALLWSVPSFRIYFLPASAVAVAATAVAVFTRSG